MVLSQWLNIDLPELRPRPEERTRPSPACSTYYKQLNYWCDSAEEEGIALQQDVPELRDIQGALDYLVGIQWKEAMPSYRAKPVSNEFLTMFWETVGLLTDIRPIFHFVDLSSGGKYSAHQKVLNRLAKGGHARRSSRGHSPSASCSGCSPRHHARSTGTRSRREPAAIRGEGDIAMEVLSPRVDRFAWEMAAMTSRRRMHHLPAESRTLDWIRRAYPTMGKYVQAENAKSKYTVDVQAPAGVEPQFFPPLSPGMKRLIGHRGDAESYESVYPRPRCRNFGATTTRSTRARTRCWMGPKTRSGAIR